jgi:MoaA/NifB/PqqE/SkfB family radical SAM enzyme
MDGTRSQGSAVEMVIQAGLTNANKQKDILHRIMMDYSVFLEEFPCDFVRTDLLKPEMLFKPKQKSVSILNNQLPRAALFHITSRCDKDCRYCYLDAKDVGDEEDALSRDEIYGIIDQFRQFGVSNIVYTGGEPFVRTDFMDILQYASDNGISATVTTKHYFTRDEVERLRDMKIVKIALSYDCHIESISDFLLRNAKNHAKKWIIA